MHSFCNSADADVDTDADRSILSIILGIGVQTASKQTKNTLFGYRPPHTLAFIHQLHISNSRDKSAIHTDASDNSGDL